jgi:osmotically-inducible protein OsmY
LLELKRSVSAISRECVTQRVRRFSFHRLEDPMVLIRRSLGIAIVAGMALATAGCDQQRNPAETAGQKIDRATENAGQKIDRASNEVAEKSKVAAAKAATILDDAALTAKVKAALFAEPGLKTLQLEVETHDGIVTIAGAVDSPVLRQRAVEIAGSMLGVRQIVDKLVVKS